MFLNYIKDFFVKKILKSSVQNLNSSNAAASIQKIGLLVDTTDFVKTEELIQMLVANGIVVENIKTVVFCDPFKKKEKSIYTAIDSRGLRWNGQIIAAEIHDFIKERFDLLISYYDVERAVLMQITHSSQAQFKVGFSLVDKRLNHFMINTEINNHTIFVSELFKYLKLLNKI